MDLPKRIAQQRFIVKIGVVPIVQAEPTPIFRIWFPVFQGLLQLPGPFDPARFLFLELIAGALKNVSGLVLPQQRQVELSAALAEPHG